MWDELLFLFNYVYYGSIGGNYCDYWGVIVLVLFGVGHFVVCFLQNNKHSSNKLFLEDWKGL